ncbi:hypothetical protein V6N11_050028 [Hibiscus sabdariffa]|uniref:Protein kinase domain-containing protein n=1 Tax=Hibiscus sabdariffa TaxID=183260 RepID=A0ABR2T9C0_9ROSI
MRELDWRKKSKREVEDNHSYITTGESSDLLSENTLFGKYEIEKLLGCGAFAKVYHVRNVRMGQSVAIKAVSKKKVLKGGFEEHVKREIAICAGCATPSLRSSRFWLRKPRFISSWNSPKVGSCSRR